MTIINVIFFTLLFTLIVNFFLKKTEILLDKKYSNHKKLTGNEEVPLFCQYWLWHIHWRVSNMRAYGLWPTNRSPLCLVSNKINNNHHHHPHRSINQTQATLAIREQSFIQSNASYACNTGTIIQPIKRKLRLQYGNNNNNT